MDSILYDLFNFDWPSNENSEILILISILRINIIAIRTIKINAQQSKL